MSFLNPIWHYLKGGRILLRGNNCIISSNNVTPLKSFQNSNNNDNKYEKQSHRIIWINVILITILHILAVYCFIRYVMEAKYMTFLWGIIVGGVGGFGITAGVHRLYAHRCYKATLPLKIILLACYSIAGQNDVYEWVRDHRMHHKFSETDADPHNSKRGLFFSHVGWLMMKKHPEISRKGHMIDMTDITNDPLVMFHTKYFFYFKVLLCFIIPTIVPAYYWNETWMISFLSQAIVRYVVNLNFTWSVNSLAHAWGKKPYNKNIKPTQNIAVAIMAMGEGWHNYHHIFPWDYKAAELGDYMFNVTTMWLDLFAKIGWAYDLKTPTKELVNYVASLHGDGSHHAEVNYKETANQN